MNILFVWNSSFKHGGGVGRVTNTLGPEFKKRGHQVYNLSFCEGEKYIKDGIESFFVSKQINESLSDSRIRIARKLIIVKEIDVIINQAGLTGPDVLATVKTAVEATGNQGIKVYTVHHNCIKCLRKNFEHIVRENYRGHRLSPLIINPIVLKLLKLKHVYKYRKTLKYLIENSDRLVLLSEYFIPDLATYLKEVPKERITAIPNPAPFEVINCEDDKENRLLYVGRVNLQQKKVDLLLKIWKRLQTRFPEWEFDVVGDGEALNALKTAADKEGLQRIHFHGYSDPVQYLKKAKFFLMTSAFEGFPMVLVEAQAYGVVPFAFKSFSSLPEVVQNDVNGCIIKPYDLEKYSDKLSELMRDEDKRNKMSASARETVSAFHPSNVAGKWEMLFGS